ncbi:glycosyltransferase family 4 protein, partial [bacterium]
MKKNLALLFSFRIALDKWYEMGIIERELKLYNLLAKDFEKIYFFTYGGKLDKQFKKYCAENIEIISVPLLQKGGDSKILIPYLFLYSLLLPLLHLKLFKKIDIIKTNQISGSWTALIAKCFYKIKLIVRCGYVWSIFSKRNKDSFIKYYLKRWIEKLAVKYSDKVICAKESDKKYLAYKKKFLEKIIIEPNYVDTELFKPMDAFKKENSLIYVGRLEQQKNLKMLLGALKDTTYSLTIIGKGSLKSELVQLAQKNKINVKFRDNVLHNDLSKIFNEHMIFVLPSLYEGTPKVLIEAMACGMPVIGTNVDGINEIVANGENGILSQLNKADLKSKINMLLNS